ncbi:hypothetical protein LJR118_003918 [Acidovorax sp. LjRoot118]|uniref:hypothetical protein n=1 Tax=Acidovorax sp. LjRoot118 TaxID=3342256 RepID=UPI003ED0A4FF
MHRIIYRPDSTWFFLVDVVKLALGIFLGGIMLFFGYEALISHRLEVASSNAAAQSIQQQRPAVVPQSSVQPQPDRTNRSR